MAGDPNSRKYNDREVQLILKSSVESQMRVAQSLEGSEGLSLAEIEEVAREVGVDPAHIRAAAARLDSPAASGEGSAVLGAPTLLVLERVLDLSLDQSRFDELLDVVRQRTGVVGEATTMGRQFGWKGKMDGAKTDVAISAGEESTTIRVAIDLEETAVGQFMLKTVMGGGMGGVATAGILGLYPLALVAGAAVLGAGYIWGRKGFQKTASDQAARGHELIDAIARRAGDLANLRAMPSLDEASD